MNHVTVARRTAFPPSYLSEQPHAPSLGDVPLKALIIASTIYKLTPWLLLASSRENPIKTMTSPWNTNFNEQYDWNTKRPAFFDGLKSEVKHIIKAKAL